MEKGLGLWSATQLNHCLRVRNETMGCKINDGQFQSVGAKKIMTLWHFEKNKSLKIEIHETKK